MNKRGFTLIEVLVVVSILGVLMGLVSVLVMKSSSHRATQEATQLVTYVDNIVQRYYAEFNRWPPNDVRELNKANKAWKDLAIVENTTNECNEALVVALRHPDFTARLEEGDLPGSEPFGNTDEDIFSQTPHGSGKPEAMEILDPWGSPVVYIHKNNYGKVYQIVNADGEPIDVEALKRQDGTYYNQTSFQVICVGRNGVPDGGGGDDFYNFKVEEEE